MEDGTGKALPDLVKQWSHLDLAYNESHSNQTQKFNATSVVGEGASSLFMGVKWKYYFGKSNLTPRFEVKITPKSVLS